MFGRGNPFQKPNERKKSLFVTAFLLAFILVLSSVTLALPMSAVAQQAPPYGTPAEEGPATEDIPEAAEAATDTSKAMTMGDDHDKKFEIVEATIEDIHNLSQEIFTEANSSTMYYYAKQVS